MGDPLKHSKSSAERFGGTADDYLHIHTLMDTSKLILAEWRHRALFQNTFGIQWHDEFDETYIIPKEYINTHWENFLRMYSNELKYITELYESLNISTKTIVYTEDIVAKEFNKLKRPIQFEILLNFDITL
jgi:hypothetical protein